MVKEIVRDIEFLSKKSEPATKEDLPIAQDLLDTLEANRERCVGMAANMIGELKNIIVFDNDGKPTIMFNAKIIEAKEKFETEEGCLSLDGVRKTIRYKKIKVKYKDIDFKPKVGIFAGFTAQIIQHELDHVAGKII